MTTKERADEGGKVWALQRIIDLHTCVVVHIDDAADIVRETREFPKHVEPPLTGGRDCKSGRQPVFVLEATVHQRFSSVRCRPRVVPVAGLAPFQCHFPCPYIPNYATTHTFVHNCPGSSLVGMMSEGFLRPSDWQSSDICKPSKVQVLNT